MLVPKSPTVASSTYLSYVNADLVTYGSSIATEVASGDPATYAGTCYYITGLTSMVESTGDLPTMDTVVGYVMSMIATAQPLVRNSITYQVWYPLDTNGNPQQADHFKAIAPMARLAALIHSTFASRYPTQLTTILAFINSAIFGYWFDKNTGVYNDPSGPYLGGTIPWLSATYGGWGTYAVWQSEATHLAIIAAYMYQATGLPIYSEYATRIGSDFKNHIQKQVGGATMWDSGIELSGAGGDPDATAGYEDTSHANREPWMIIALYETGIVYTLADIAGMSYIFLDFIWNQDIANPMFYNYINGSNVAYRTATAYQNGIIYAGWSMLAKYSDAVRYVVDKSNSLIRIGSGLNTSLSENNSSYGRICLSGNLSH